MTVFFDQKSGDTWNFAFDNGILDFSFCFKGRKHGGLMDYKAAYSGTTMPFIVTKSNRYQINTYTWMSNEWFLKKFSFQSIIMDFFISKDNMDQCHIVIETGYGNNKKSFHFFHEKNKWVEGTLPETKFNIINLTYLSIENKLLLTVFDQTTRILKTYIWNNLTKNWDDWTFSMEISIGSILCVGYTKNMYHLVTLIKDQYFKLSYKGLCVNRNIILTESTIVLLPSFYPRDCCLLKDNDLIAIFCTSFQQRHFFFQKNSSKWSEVPIKYISANRKISNVFNGTGYISSSLAFLELFNTELKSPVMLKASQIVELSKNIMY